MSDLYKKRLSQTVKKKKSRKPSYLAQRSDFLAKRFHKKSQEEEDNNSRPHRQPVPPSSTSTFFK
ncbi:hypothetical protein AGABI2DRAFT_120331 [Agaricus bisporus var. bisporus H97]|uniref:hypothetical protein n=1 Tax=Agaricus bisporus var. bisporus (strain H97 / ATCC MYA-4626 / FGSC 10389) TaxID=936046 RepID=UPI00029F6496|nr:hypothetical protein AGABI2DRAFT_120331 [Agaricus bisporus var. bisporus H97]EKV45375.1 hypothetical protein AGABI2DRAFT_120331 [Agaricus bisporus var. bisporus H97]